MARKILNVSFILDETGSMGSCKQQTIDGFNEYIQTLSGEKGSDSIRFTLTKFNSGKIHVAYDGVALDKVEPLNHTTYQPADMTPLYDAIGQTIRAIEKHLEGKKKANVLVVIQTDGQENYSKEYNQLTIFNLIEEKKKLGWTFAFLGADQDAWLTSQKIGIDFGNTMSYSSSETHMAFATTARAAARYTRTGGIQTSNLFNTPDEEEE